MEQINYTIINHTARLKLGLTLSEYCVADLIYNLSNNPSGNGWCYASKPHMGEMMGLTEQGMHKILNKLLAMGLVEKNPITKHLRTTPKWYGSVVIKDTKQSLATLKSVAPYHSTEFSPTTKQSLDNNDSYKDNYKEEDSEISDQERERRSARYAGLREKARMLREA